MSRDPIEEAKEVVSNFNSNLTLIGWATKKKRTVRVNCNIHGNAWEWGNPYTPRLDHLKKGNSGCPKCSNCYRMSKGEKIEHLNTVINSDYVIVDIPDYKNTYSKCHISCQYHGNGWEWHNPWVPTITNLQQGQGCPKCAINRKAKKSEGEVIDIVSSRLPSNLKVFGIKEFRQLELSTLYVTCTKHGNCWEWGNPWIPTGGAITSGRNCPKCSNRYTPTKNEIFDELEHEEYELIDIPDYKNRHSLCLVRCPIHGNGWKWGNPWKPKVIKLRIGDSACPKCSNVYRPTQKEVLDALNECLNDSSLSFVSFTDYTGYDSECYVRCEIHGNAWEWSNPWMPSANLLKKYGSCIKCTGAYARSEEENAELIRSILPPHLTFHKFIEYDGLISRCAITCKYHGNGWEWHESWVPRLGNILAGTRCPKCSAGSTNLINVLRNEELQEQGRILYYIEFLNLANNTKFWKVGVASIDGGVRVRYRPARLLADNIEIVTFIEIKTTTLLALACEYKILMAYDPYRIDQRHVMISASGGTECFHSDITEGSDFEEIFNYYTRDKNRLVKLLRHHFEFELD